MIESNLSKSQSAVISLHFLTGCDTCDLFNGISKSNWIKAFPKYINDAHMISASLDFDINVQVDINDTALSTIEKFARLYLQQAEVT